MCFFCFSGLLFSYIGSWYGLGHVVGLKSTFLMELTINETDILSRTRHNGVGKLLG